MMISKKLADKINEQIGNEFGAHFQYINIATYFDEQALPKIAKLFYEQGEEEHEHAMKLLKYLVDVGAPVAIPAIPASQATFKSAEECFQLSVNWENEVTAQIHNLFAIARKDNDYASENFLAWFVEEQIEEVGKMENLLKIVQRAGEKNLIMMEAYLSHE